MTIDEAVAFLREEMREIHDSFYEQIEGTTLGRGRWADHYVNLYDAIDVALAEIERLRKEL